MSESDLTTHFLLHQPTLRSHLVSAGYLKSWYKNALNTYARSHLLDVLRRGIVNGVLIIEENSERHEFGSLKSQKTGRSVHMTVHNADFWMRIMTSHDLGVSEAYMHQDFDVSSLKDLLNLWLDNRASLSGLENTFSGLFARYSALAINALGRQNLSTSRWHVNVAYDTSNELFESFLSKEMMYSCAYWGDEEGGVRGDLISGPTPGDLESAQQRKIHRILQHARVKSGDRLLEIGSGWGAMAIEAARMGCTVDTVTLSREQMSMTLQRAEEAGVLDRVRVLLCDYRDLPSDFEHAFDAVVACEMIEAVGKRYMPTFFKAMDWALKREKATMVITATSQPEHRYSEYQPDDFARHYHWPNCYLPSATSLAVSVQEAVPGRFVLAHLEDHAPHYCRTLREWNRRFDANFHSDVVRAVQARHPHLLDPAALDAFRRKWIYMFVYAEVGYARAYTALNCWTFTRPENVSQMCS